MACIYDSLEATDLVKHYAPCRLPFLFYTCQLLSSHQGNL